MVLQGEGKRAEDYTRNPILAQGTMKRSRLSPNRTPIYHAAAPWSPVAFVGAVNHDWTVVVPFADTRVGVIEWQTGSSTVFLGPVDFRFACGARATVAILSLVGLIVALAVFGMLTRGRSARKWSTSSGNRT